AANRAGIRVALGLLGGRRQVGDVGSLPRRTPADAEREERRTVVAPPPRKHLESRVASLEHVVVAGGRGRPPAPPPAPPGEARGRLRGRGGRRAPPPPRPPRPAPAAAGPGRRGSP